MNTNLNKTRLTIIVLVIIFIIVIAVAASGGGGNKPSTPTGQAVCTVNSGVGLATVKITNGAGNTIIKTPADLPFSFNFTKGDTLQFNVTVLVDYRFNAWTFNTGTFDNNNPLIIRVEKDIAMTANCIPKGLAP